MALESKERITDKSKDTAPASFFKKAYEEEKKGKGVKSVETTGKKPYGVVRSGSGKIEQVATVDELQAQAKAEAAARQEKATPQFVAKQSEEKKPAMGEVRPSVRPTGIAGVSQGLYTTQQKLEQERERSTGIKNIGLGLAEFGVGIGSFAVGIGQTILHPVETVKGGIAGAKQFISDPIKTSTLIRLDIESRPLGFVGELTGQVLTSKFVSKGYKAIKTSYLKRKNPVTVSEIAVSSSYTEGTKVSEKYIGNLKVSQGKKSIPVKVDARAITLQGEEISTQTGLIKVKPKGQKTTNIAQYSQIISKGDEAEALTEVAVLNKKGFAATPKQQMIFGTKSVDIADTLKQSVSIGSTNVKTFDYAGYSASELIFEIGDDLGTSKIYNIRGKAVSSPTLGKTYSKAIYENIKGSRPSVSVNIPSAGATKQQLAVVSSEGMLQQISKQSAIQAVRPQLASELTKTVQPAATKAATITKVATSPTVIKIPVQEKPVTMSGSQSLEIKPVASRQQLSLSYPAKMRKNQDSVIPSSRFSEISRQSSDVDIASISRIKQRSSARTRSVLDSLMGTEAETRLDQVQTPVMDQIFKTKQAQEVVTTPKYIIRPIQTYRSNGIISPRIPLIIPNFTIVSPKPSFQLKFFGGKRKKKKGATFQTEYTPSIEAQFFNVVGKPTRAALPAGLDIRPFRG